METLPFTSDRAATLTNGWEKNLEHPDTQLLTEVVLYPWDTSRRAGYA